MTLPKRSEGPPAIPSWARIGAKVVFVGGGTDSPSLVIEAPVKGVIYTIREILPSGKDGLAYIRIGEIVVKRRWNALPFGEDAWLGLRTFKPLITLEADLEAHFSQLLHVPSTHTVDA